jgi:beta-N-acetylhexosaminidase
MRLYNLLGCLLLLLSFTTVQAQDDDQINAIIAEMTLERKVAQMFMVNLYGSGLTEVGRDMLQTWQPGAVVLLGPNTEQSPEQIAQLTNSYQQTIIGAGGVPLFIATDQEGGMIQRLRAGFTIWPVPMLLTAANDTALSYRMGQGMAAELRAVGVNMNLAPVADLQTNLANPIIGRRSPGSDPLQVGYSLYGLVGGMQSVGVMATLKHFPGHGETDEDSHTTLPELPLDLGRLRDVELPPFIYGMPAGAVMVSHIWFSEFDPEPLPASLSPTIVTDLLRNELGYQGIIITDALDMDAIDTAYSPSQAAVMSVQAGNDMVLIGANAGEQIQARAMQAVVDAVRAGEIDEAQIDASVYRVLYAKQQFGVFDWEPVEPEALGLPLEENATLVRDIFKAGVTVVRDERDVLPFDPGDSVGVIFPGTRYSIQSACETHDENLRSLAVSEGANVTDIARAVRLASEVETVVVFTQDAYINDEQAALVNALPARKTLVVALASPYDLLRFPDVGGYVVTYSPIDPAAEVACALLFGAIQPVSTPSVSFNN